MSETKSSIAIPDFRWQVEHYAEFDKIDILPEELTERLGLQPTKTYRSGDRASSKRTWQWSGWQLDSPVRDDIDTVEMNRSGMSGLIDLVSMFHERLNVIRSVCPPATLHFTTIIATDSSCPSIGLDFETSRRIVELGATWSATWSATIWHLTRPMMKDGKATG